MSDTSTLFEMMASVHRRRILLLLLENESLQIPEDVQTRSTSQQRTKQPVRQGQATEQSSAISHVESEQSLELHYVHRDLPKLESEDFIRWDRATQTVSRGTAYEDIVPALKFIAENPTKFSGDLL